MQFKNISSDTIRITLTKEELRVLFGKYKTIDYQSIDIQRKLKEILKKAATATSTNFNAQNLYIEVIQDATGGCTVFYTRYKNRQILSQKHIRMRQNENSLIGYKFIGPNSLLSAIESLKRINFKEYKIFKYKSGNYLFVAQHNVCEPAKAILSENANYIIRLNKAQAAFANEHLQKI